MDEQKIIFSNRFEKEKFEDYKTDFGTGNTITPDFTEADDFLKFIRNEPLHSFGQRGMKCTPKIRDFHKI